MTTEPYAPNEDELIVAYFRQRIGEVDRPDSVELEAEAVRGIAKIKADALREFAKEWGDGREGFPYFPLMERADRIEEEA